MNIVTGTMVSVQTMRFSAESFRRKPFLFYREVNCDDRKEDDIKAWESSIKAKSCNGWIKVGTAQTPDA